jgi:hypothetical protein
MLVSFRSRDEGDIREVYEEMKDRYECQSWRQKGCDT